MVEEAGVIRKFIGEDMHITPQALSILRDRGDLQLAAERALESFKAMPERPSVITEELVKRALEGEVKPQAPPPKTPGAPKPKFAKPPTPRPAALEPKPTERLKPRAAYKRFKPLAAEVEPQIEVLRDITGHSNTQGELKDFLKLFNDRYDRLSRILKGRIDLRGAIPIDSVSAHEDKMVKIIGMVVDKRETRKRDLIIEIEDPSGRAVLFINKNRRELMEKAAEVVTDEVIGVGAKVPKSRGGGRRSPLIFANDIIWPDVPFLQKKKAGVGEVQRPEESICAALISDLHVGSEMFLEDVFMKFLKWLRGEVGNRRQRELAARVKYLVIAGDLVDGIGIYPRQEEELVIRDINKQYDAVAEYLSQVPEHVKIILAPGNHDAVRALEPQPTFPKDIASILESVGPIMIGNPAYLQIHGTKFLVYHGRGFDDLISADSSLDRVDSVKPMVKSLKKRHLAPIYGEPMGGRAPLAPEERDYLVIDEVPDVFHCGHLHVYGYGKYRGVVLINSATFQERTIYMKGKGVKPTPGIVPIVDLQTNQARAIHFA